MNLCYMMFFQNPIDDFIGRTPETKERASFLSEMDDSHGNRQSRTLFFLFHYKKHVYAYSVQ